MDGLSRKVERLLTRGTAALGCGALTSPGSMENSNELLEHFQPSRYRSRSVGHRDATGARIVTTLANEMKRRKVRYGLVSICAAGAQSSAMILERDV